MRLQTTWLLWLKRGAIFFLTTLILLSVARIVFFLHYKSAELTFADFIPALVMGTRVDLKWLCTAMLPAWLFFLLSARFRLFNASKFFACLALFLAALLCVINFGYYGFYASPINAVIFGLFQDDTGAILSTLLEDWPIASYVLVLVAFCIVPCLATKLVPYAEQRLSLSKFSLFAFAVSILMAVCIRGSFGTFPLRVENFAVSPIPFINATVPNGMAVLYEANKSRKALSLGSDPLGGMKAMGFKTETEAQAALEAIEKIEPNAEKQAPLAGKNVVVAVMESMGRDQFESHRGKDHDQLGALFDELPNASVYKHGICVGPGTFPSLEGILFGTPLTPLSQSAYGRKPFEFSQAMRYKKAGYRTIFLTACTESWRNISETFPIHGFDEVIGTAKIHEKFPQAEIGTWGIGDKWMFLYAEHLLEEAKKSGTPLFIAMLSATNHPPHHVPDGDFVASVDPDALPDCVIIERRELAQAMMQTYRYSANALGEFVHWLKTSGMQSDTVLAVTGDHNARFNYKPDGYWHHHYGVPVLFWLPQQADIPAGEQNRWVSHRDIFPSINALVLGETPEMFEGRNLFANPSYDIADSFFGPTSFGFAIGNWGAIVLDKNGSFSCHRWSENGDQLTPVTPCTEELSAIGKAVAARRGLSDAKIRSAVLKND